MKVSVLIITYNQERFIAQALSSILMQTVDFPYEVVIGEDASTDGTAEIVQEFASRHPDKLRLLFRDAAAARRDRAAGLGGKGNFVNCLEACKGQYVALLDGDDYWISPYKLQKQADFLDQHSDFAISFHQARVVYDDGTEAANRSLHQREVLSLEDLLDENPIPACSVMFRRGLFGKLPDWFYSAKIGDWPIHIMNAQYGKIGRINEVMAAYRIHPKGAWPSLNPVGQRLEMIKLLDHLDAYLGFKYKKRIRAAKAVWYHQLAWISLRQGDRAKARTYMVKCLLLRGFKGAKQLFRRQVTTFHTPIRTIKTFLGSAMSG